MRKSSLWVVFFALSVVWVGCNTFSQTANAQSSQQVELANLRADMQVLDRRLREMNNAMEDLIERNRRLSNEIEQLKRKNSELNGMVHQSQLDRAISDLQQRMQAANADQRRQIIREVTQQIDALGKQTQTAIDAVARNVSSRPSSSPVSRPTFSEDFPKEGISYTVRSGDTLSGIASRNNSTIRDIQNANQITNPAAIQVGQTLFIPQRNN